MSRRRFLVAALLAVPLLLVAAVWILPGRLDWNRYRDGIATLASARVGRPVRIGGAVTLHLLPQPILTAADVSLEDDGDGIGLRARALRLRVGLGALLAGTLDARELTLQGAELRLPWPLPPGALAQRPPSWITGLSARMEDGRLQVGGLVLDHIDGTLSTDPDTGTLSAAGVGQGGTAPDTRSWQFTARLARPGRDGGAGLEVSLDGQGRLRDTGGTFSGQLGSDGALSGRVAARGPDLSQLMAGPAVPWRGDGRLGASGGLAVADDLALEIGGVPARGAVALRVTPDARLDLALATGRLDLDAWLPALLNQVGRTSVLPIGVDVSAEAASWAGGTVRRLRAALDLGEAGGGLTLREVSAVLPGEARLELDGQVAAGAVFTGPVRLTAPDLRATLRWAQGAVPAAVQGLVPDGSLPVSELLDRVLRSGALSARVVAGPGSVAVTELRGTLDGAGLSGTLAVRGAPGGRAGVTANLVLERLALDRTARLPAGWAEALAGLAPLRTVDAEVRLQVAAGRWGALPLGAVLLDGQTDAGRVVLRRLELQPLGARLTLSGQVTAENRLVDGRAELAAPDLAALRPLLPMAPPAFLDLLLRGPGGATVAAAGPAEALAARLTLDASDLRIDAQPVLNLVSGRAAGALTVHHPGAPRLVETLGMGAVAAWLGDGSVSLVGQFAASAGRQELTGATLTAGAARASGQVVLEGRKLTGQVTAETLPLPLPYSRSPDPLPLGWLRSWQGTLRLDANQVLMGLDPVMAAAGAELSLRDGTLRLARLTGRVAGGTVTGSAALDAAAEPPALSVQLQGGNLLVPDAGAPVFPVLSAGQAEGSLDLHAQGHSPAALLSTLGGGVTVRVRNGLLQGTDLVAAAAAIQLPDAQDAAAGVRAALVAGTTPLESLDGRAVLERGVATGEAELSTEAGRGRLTGALDLRDGTQDLRLLLTPGAEPQGGRALPTVGLRLTGPVGAPARVPELAELARFLAEGGAERGAGQGAER